MKKENITFSYEVFDSVNELPEADQLLLKKARQITALAYAPYSHFMVGAAALLQNAETITGTNQENASFPAGICAERVLLSATAAVFPGIAINTIAISYDNKNKGISDHPVFPCGICRQSLVEYEIRQKQSIQFILGGLKGKIYVIHKAAILLPFSFSGSDL